jgi:two-component sensor histidine kinase
LDYQNVIVGNVEPELTWTSVNDLILELTTGAKYAANQKSINIKKNLDENLDTLEINIDRLRISQILSNLISNAITHTPSKGEIIVSVKLIHINQNQCKLRFSITDNGVGMTRAELSKIGDRYFSKSKEKQLHTNFGLGLTIVHELLSLMNTELVVESEKGSGSRFSFEIDALSRTKAVEKVEKIDHENILKSLKILIIEDDEQVLEMYRFFFEDAKAHYLSSFDEIGQNIFDKYDVIISDYQLANDRLSNHLKILKNISTPDTSLLVVSGGKPNFSKIEEVFPEFIFVHKPVDKASLFYSIALGRICTKYGRPTLDAIQKDYDFNETKINKAMSLLLEEWKIYHNRIIQGIKKEDGDELDEILHKFINTLRRLNLPKFEQYLVSLKDRINSKVIDVEKECLEINQIMDVYYTFILSSFN